MSRKPNALCLDQANKLNRFTEISSAHELSIGNVLQIIKKDLSCSTKDAYMLLVELNVSYRLKFLEQGRIVDTNAVTSALYESMEAGHDKILIGIPTLGGPLLKRKFRNCTITREAMREALIIHRGVDGLPSWPGLEVLLDAPQLCAVTTKNPPHGHLTDQTKPLSPEYTHTFKRRSNKTWIIGPVGQEQDDIDHMIGFTYIHHLLKRTGRSTDAAVLDSLKNILSDGCSQQDDLAIDEGNKPSTLLSNKMRIEYSEQISRLEEQEATAEASGNTNEVNRLNEIKDLLYKEINCKLEKPRNKIKEDSRSRVSAAIRRAKKHIHEKVPEMDSVLVINTGGSCLHEKEDEVIWNL